MAAAPLGAQPAMRRFHRGEGLFVFAAGVLPAPLANSSPSIKKKIQKRDTDSACQQAQRRQAAALAAGKTAGCGRGIWGRMAGVRRHVQRRPAAAQRGGARPARAAMRQAAGLRALWRAMGKNGRLRRSLFRVCLFFCSKLGGRAGLPGLRAAVAWGPGCLAGLRRAGPVCGTGAQGRSAPSRCLPHVCGRRALPACLGPGAAGMGAKAGGAVLRRLGRAGWCVKTAVFAHPYSGGACFFVAIRHKAGQGACGGGRWQATAAASGLTCGGCSRGTALGRCLWWCCRPGSRG